MRRPCRSRRSRGPAMSFAPGRRQMSRGRLTRTQVKETIMNDAADAPGIPPVAERAAWQAQLDDLLAREKAHTREGDAIAAARRRLPMVQVDPAIPLMGPNGPVPLLEVFEGRRQLIAYFFMWHADQPAEAQCEGCTFFNGQVRELSYLHSRDVTFATFCEGPYDESIRYRDFMGWDMPWYSAEGSAEALLAGRWFGMQVCYPRHDGVRQARDLGRLSSRLAAAVRDQRRAVPHQRAPHRPVAAAGRRAPAPVKGTRRPAAALAAA